MTDWISTQIDHVLTGTRGLTPQLWRVVRAHLETLANAGQWQQRQILLKAMAPVSKLWRFPTAEQARTQIDLLRQEKAELAPWVDMWPEHRCENTLANYTQISVSIYHFSMKLHEIEKGVFDLDGLTEAQHVAA